MARARMVGTSSVEIRGLKELGRELDKLGKAIAADATADAAEAGGEVILDRAEAGAPRGSGPLGFYTSKKTGERTYRKVRVRDSLILEVDRKGDEALAGVGPSEKSKIAFIVRFNEFGTRYMSSNAFLRPAIDTGHPKAIEAIRGSFTKSIDRWF